MKYGVKALALIFESPQDLFGGMGMFVRKTTPLFENFNVQYEVLSSVRSEHYHSPGAIRIFDQDRYAIAADNCSLMLAEAMRLHLEHNFDVIHTHDWSGWIVGQRLSYVINKPVLHTVHLLQDEVLHSEKHQGKNLDNIMFHAAHEYNACSWADELHVCSSHIASYIRKTFEIDRETHVIPCGVDVEEFAGEHQPRKRKNVLFCGRFAQQKGFDLVLELIERCPDLHFTLVGRVSTYDPKLANQHPYMLKIAELEKKYPERISHKGHLDGDAKVQEFLRADAVLMPSVLEPFGIVALEAMAARVPLVTTGVDGMKDFISDKNAFFCESDVESIERALRMALSGGGEKIVEGMKTACTYDWNRVTKKLSQIMEGMKDGKALSGCDNAVYS